MLIISILSTLAFAIISIIIIPFKNRHVRSKLALILSTLCFLISVLLWIVFNSLTSQFQCIMVPFDLPLGVDGISLYFILLTTFLFPICILFSWDIHTKIFLICIISIELLLLLVFLVMDLLWFYIFFETVLIPIFLIIGIWGSRTRKIKAAYYFFIYTLVGSLIILTGIIYIYSAVGTTIYFSLFNYHFTFTEEKWLWLSFFISFAIKVPIFPFHIWLPEAHVEAPTTGSVILAGILLKLGVYGFVRYSICLFPKASIYFAPFVSTLGLVGILYASFIAVRQKDLKKIVAYTSIAHINLVVIGIFSFTAPGLHGCLIQSLSHGLVSAALFLLIGILYNRHRSRLYLHYTGLAHIIPLFSFFFLFFTFANIGLPGTSSFIGEFLLLTGILKKNALVGTVGASTIIFIGIYSLWVLNRSVYGSLKLQYAQEFKDLDRIEFFIILIITIAVLGIGLYPEFFFKNVHTSLSFSVLQK